VAKEGLGKWFKEDWVDIKTGKACGRSGKKDKRGYPACRPKKVASKMTAAEKRTCQKRKLALAVKNGMLLLQVKEERKQHDPIRSD